MLAKLDKDAIDLGIVVRDADASLRFYRDLLGFPVEGEVALPGGGVMHRLLCGGSVIKLVKPGKPPAAEAPGGGLQGATGYRYWTLRVTNLDEIGKALEEAGCNLPIKPMEFRPGVRICMVEDPDGNWVEFAEYADGAA